MSSAALEAGPVAQILVELRARTGMDFSRYRAATVRRRIANRMISLRVGSCEAYLDRLRTRPEEAPALLARIAIKVSRFYRNPPAFDLLRAEVLPRLRREAGGAPLRLWSAGCGNGEEAYTLAMLLEEAGCEGTVQATDIDPAALAAAQRGLYPREAGAELPPALAARYLTALAQGGRACLGVRPELRARVSFVRHDLLFAAPPAPARFDLASCRNVLIYLEPDARRQVLRTLYRALRPGGVLLLGEAEWPAEPLPDALELVSRNARLFRCRGPA